MTWRPAGRVAVVTGGSSGIGAATARRLAAAGMQVVVVARRAERLEALAGEHPRIVPHPADVTDTAAVDKLAGRVADEMGACHALINNAGIRGPWSVRRDDLEAVLHTLDVNLLGAVRCTAAFADLLAASAPSRLVNIASVSGKIGVGPPAYVASKFGMVGLSESLGFTWGERGVTVSQINPGLVHTEGFPKDELLGTPLERVLAEPDDVAAAVLEVLVSGAVERTVPRWYRPMVVSRHVAAPVYRGIAGRVARGRAGHRGGGADPDRHGGDEDGAGGRP